MASFEDMAGELTTTVHELKSRREKLKREIEEDQNQCERIESELEILIDRKKEIEGSAKQFKNEKEELTSVIVETEATKQKIIESLKFLGANLKKFKITEKY